jgi:hypothetical protein
MAAASPKRRHSLCLLVNDTSNIDYAELSYKMITKATL